MLLIMKLISLASNYNDPTTKRIWRTASRPAIRAIRNRPSRRFDRCCSTLATCTTLRRSQLYDVLGRVRSRQARPSRSASTWTSRPRRNSWPRNKVKQPTSAFAAFSWFLMGSVLVGLFAHFVPQYPSSNLYSLSVAALPLAQQVLYPYITPVFCKAK